MNARIDMLGIFAGNMQVMVPFYHDILGFETDWDGQTPYAEFKNEGVRFSMYRRKELANLFEETPTFPPALNGTFEIALDFPTSADADREYERIVASGARSLYAPRDEPWGMRSSMVADPEGNLIEIGSWNKGEKR